MTLAKYNFPPKADQIFLALQRRVAKLERTSAPTDSIGPIKATDYNSAVVVSSATFVDTHIYPATVTAPTPVVYFTAACSLSGLAGEWQIVDEFGTPLTGADGNTVGPFSIPIGTITPTLFTNRFAVPNYWSSIDSGTRQVYKLQVRVSSGTGSISIIAQHLIQIPS